MSAYSPMAWPPYVYRSTILHGLAVQVGWDAVQVVDCRRILKWTYAYGYYRFGDQATSNKMSKDAQEALARQQEFFEFNQVCCCPPVPSPPCSDSLPPRPSLI